MSVARVKTIARALVSPRILLAYPAGMAFYLAVTYGLWLLGATKQAELLGGLTPIVHMAAFLGPVLMVAGGIIADEMRTIVAYVCPRRIDAKKQQ